MQLITEFIIPPFIKGSTCFEQYAAHHQELQLYLQPLVYMCMWWPAVVKTEWELRLDYGRSPHEYVNQRLQIQLELLMMSGVPLETCWAFDERWNNEFCYKLHLVICFYWIILWCTDPLILKIKLINFSISHFN
jgi:hypothetical protein